MKSVTAIVLSLAFLFASLPLRAQDATVQEKIRDVSPDKKFAVCVKYDPSIDDGSSGDISNEAIRSIDVVAMPAKTVVANLLQGGDELASVEGNLIWSGDSKWFAFAEGEGHRVTTTSVFHWKGDKFEGLDTDQLTVPPGGDARNQYVTPLRWLKPGTLVLKQFTIFFYEKGESTFEFTVRFDENGKFRVINRKKVRRKDE